MSKHELQAAGAPPLLASSLVSRKRAPLKLAAAAALTMSGFAHPASAAEFFWDGGTDANFNWSDAENWNPDAAPPATGNTLAFEGTTGLSSNNDGQVTSLVNNATAGRGAITFEAGAGAFTLTGTPINWATSANGRFV